MITYEVSVVCDSCMESISGIPYVNQEEARKDAAGKAYKAKWIYDCDGATWTCPKCLEQITNNLKKPV